MGTLVNDTADVLSLLRERGAEGIEHPGGTLLAHLVRVSHRLSRLSNASGVQLAGLAHACYGTDGFPLALMDHQDRSALQALIGAGPEALVFVYAGCDRGRSWRSLAATREVWSRFDGSPQTLDDAELRAFTDLCIVNELDVLERSPAVAAAHLGAFSSLFDSWRGLASPAVMDDADRTLNRLREAQAVPKASSTGL